MEQDFTDPVKLELAGQILAYLFILAFICYTFRLAYIALKKKWNE